jgi:hypothetical protein
MKYREAEMIKAWRQASPVKPENAFRRDRCLAWIQWIHFGNAKSIFGWIIDEDTKEAVHYRNRYGCRVIGRGFDNVIHRGVS